MTSNIYGELIYQPPNTRCASAR